MTQAIQHIPDPADRFSVSRFEIMLSVSTALDLISPTLNNHHNLVCFIAASIAEELELEDSDFNDVFLASLFHDIGIIALSDRVELLNEESERTREHGKLGGILLRQYPPLAHIAPLVTYHHAPWKHGNFRAADGEDIPVLSHLIHVADRVAVLFKSNVPVLVQASRIEAEIHDQSGPVFAPIFVDAFHEVAKRESFWLDANQSFLSRILKAKCRLPNLDLGLTGLSELARFFSLIIDTRSRYTATHSSGVATCAKQLARIMGFPDLVCRKMELAGYLHDIGKLSIPSELIEKNGPLSDEERRIINAHPYFTRRVLEHVAGLEDITLWASQHHEKPSGDGYPYHKKGEEFPLESRILAVADVFTALTETRSYRDAFQPRVVREILVEAAGNEELDRRVVEVLMGNYDLIKEACVESQDVEKNSLSEFWEVAHQPNRYR